MPLLSDKIVLASYLFGLLRTLSLLFYKVMDAVFNKVSIPVTVVLSVAVLVSAFNVSISFFSSYWNVLLLFTVLLTFLIKCITGSRLVKLLYISIL